MDDDHLRHLCKLAAVAVHAVRLPDWVECVETATESELRDQHTCLQILGDAFVELARRQGMLPTFRVPARPPGDAHAP